MNDVSVTMSQKVWESIHALLLISAMDLDSEGDPLGARQVVGFAARIGQELGPDARAREDETREVLAA